MTRKEIRKVNRKRGKAGGLMARARGLYKAAGHKFGPGVTLAVMVSTVVGKRMTKAESWAWLIEESDAFVSAKIAAQTIKRAKSSSFMRSQEWRVLRFEVLRESNGSCSLCGRSNREHGVILHVDHIKPKSLYPELALHKPNLQVLCEDCNMGKGNRDETDWRTGTETDRHLDSFDWRTL